MSRGSRVIGFRVPAELEREIVADIARLQTTSREEPPTLTMWVLAAIRERLAKRARSRTRKPREVAGDGQAV